MTRWETQLLTVLRADSTATEWAMSALAFVWGVAAVVSQIGTAGGFYADHWMQGNIWYLLNAVMATAALIRLVVDRNIARHRGDTERVLFPLRRFATGILGAAWATMGVYLYIHWNYSLFAVIFGGASLIELWIFLRLSMGVKACDG